MDTPFSPANLAFMLLASFILVRAKNTALRSFRSRGTRAVALACLKRQRHSDPHPSRQHAPRTRHRAEGWYSPPSPWDPCGWPASPPSARRRAARNVPNACPEWEDRTVGWFPASPSPCRVASRSLPERRPRRPHRLCHRGTSSSSPRRGLALGLLSRQ